MKRLILHDLPDEQALCVLPLASDDITVFSALPPVKGCIGCFGCWVKTPGACVINDRAREFSRLIASHEEVVIVSRMVFGSVSPEIKAVFERSIGFILPFFQIVEDEMHHKQRYDFSPALTYVFYKTGISELEKDIAQRLSAANRVNYSSSMGEVIFCDDSESIKEALA